MEHIRKPAEQLAYEMKTRADQTRKKIVELGARKACCGTRAKLEQQKTNLRHELDILEWTVARIHALFPDQETRAD